ncbi:type VII secretion protein [Streptomyces boninensis]|uniref:type VII secretion protein n=1 Tax=Streptomyces boninensis TaxID=2039455 RepID=UPI003B2175DB
MFTSAGRAVGRETQLAQQIQQPVTTGRHIAVTSIRGGAGKTTVAGLLTRAFAHYRHDPILALEADAALGTLPVRLGAKEVRWSCEELAQILHPNMQLTDVTGYLVPLAEGAWLLPASQGQIGARVDVQTYRLVVQALRRYFAVTVIDGETLPGEVARTAMNTAHAHVIAAPATAEGVAGTFEVLRWMSAPPLSLAPRTVVVLSAAAPVPGIDVANAAWYLGQLGVEVAVLPYDRHLAGGGAIRTDRLAEPTRQAAIYAAAAAMQRAVGVR